MNTPARPLDSGFTYDFFVAHASADRGHAERLTRSLEPEFNVFLAVHDIPVASDWGTVINDAQRGARFTVALISENTNAAVYAMDEIRAAIEREKSTGGIQRLIPVYLRGIPRSTDDYLYGMRTRQGLPMTNDAEFDNVVAQLRTAGREPPRTPSNAQAVAPARPSGDQPATDQALPAMTWWRAPWAKPVAISGAAAALVAIVLAIALPGDDESDRAAAPTSPAARAIATDPPTLTQPIVATADTTATAGPPDTEPVASNPPPTPDVTDPAPISPPITDPPPITDSPRQIVPPTLRTSAAVTVSPAADPPQPIGTLTVAAGEWVLVGSVSVIAHEQTAFVRCGFHGPTVSVGGTVDVGRTAGGGSPYMQATVLGHVMLGAPQTLELRCTYDGAAQPGEPMRIDQNAHLVAIPTSDAQAVALTENSPTFAAANPRELLSLDLPAGRSVVLAAGSVVDFGAVAHVRCSLLGADGSLLDTTITHVGARPHHRAARVMNLAVVELDAPMSVSWRCSVDELGAEAYVDGGATLVAFQPHDTRDTGMLASTNLLQSPNETWLWSDEFANPGWVVISRVALANVGSTDAVGRCSVRGDAGLQSAQVVLLNNGDGDRSSVVDVVAAPIGRSELYCANSGDGPGEVDFGSRVIALLP